jgi:hypothetical protein
MEMTWPTGKPPLLRPAPQTHKNLLENVHQKPLYLAPAPVAGIVVFTACPCKFEAGVLWAELSFCLAPKFIWGLASQEQRNKT